MPSGSIFIPSRLRITLVLALMSPAVLVILVSLLPAVRFCQSVSSSVLLLARCDLL